MVLADGSSLAGPTAAFDPPQPMALCEGEGWSANYCLLERELCRSAAVALDTAAASANSSRDNRL